MHKPQYGTLTSKNGESVLKGTLDITVFPGFDAPCYVFHPSGVENKLYVDSSEWDFIPDPAPLPTQDGIYVRDTEENSVYPDLFRLRYSEWRNAGFAVEEEKVPRNLIRIWPLDEKEES